MLEQRLESMYHENAELRASVASLQMRLALHEQRDQQHSQQVLHINLLHAEETQASPHRHSQSLVFSSKRIISACCSSRKQVECGQCMNVGASITEGFSALCLVAWVSAGLWIALLSNHPHPCHSNFHLHFWIPLVHVVWRLESGTSGFLLLKDVRTCPTLKAPLSYLVHLSIIHSMRVYFVFNVHVINLRHR